MVYCAASGSVFQLLLLLWLEDGGLLFQIVIVLVGGLPLELRGTCELSATG